MSPRNYFDAIVSKLAVRLGDEHCCQDDLLHFYAVLVLVKGAETSRADVHEAWAAWKSLHNPFHRAIVPFDKLPPDVQELDEPFAAAIRACAAGD